MNEVTIKIVGVQTTFDGEESTIELITEGKHYEKNGNIFLVYDESKLSGMEGSTTTLKIEDKKIMMKRFGKNESKLMFEKGKRHKTEYKTPYGNMDMEIVTNKINIEKNEKGLKKLDLSYRMSVSRNTELKNKLSISVI